VQWNVDAPAQLHAGTVAAWKNVGGRVNINMSEFADSSFGKKPFSGTGDSLRRKIWAIAMGGGYSMILGMDIESTPVADLQACGHLVRFMESTRFNRTSPRDDLARGDTDYVLAAPGQVYIAYGGSGGRLGLNLSAGRYRVRWFNPRNGGWADEEDRSLADGEQRFSRPASFSDEAVLYLEAVTMPETRRAEPIDRIALVRRHNPVVRKADALTPFSLGNGAFAFNVDITGLQTFAGFHDKGIPLCIQSYWGWHSFPNPDNYRLEDTLVDFDTYGRMVKYATNMKSKAGEWLRSNPHRLGLGRISLELIKSDNSPAVLEDLKDIDQSLDLWSGLLTSRFVLEGSPVEVKTCCHPDLDAIAVRIGSPLVSARRLRVAVSFPYGSGQFGKEPGDWDHPELHETTVIGRTESRIDLQRTLDSDKYYVSVVCPKGTQFQTTKPHYCTLVPAGGGSSLEFVAAFSPTPVPADVPDVGRCQVASNTHWKHFWSDGGAIDLSASTDPRAHELERRVVLSQYLMAIQCAGPMPPPETGLTFNSWYGKPHLECHWWHGVHFALWNRLSLLEKSLPWYRSILPMARKTAAMQGYRGARWPKMVGPDGREGPSVIAPLLIWQQPHPIYYAELCYRAHPDRETLELYRDIVFESAEFMASYAVWDKDRHRYVLGPPVMPAQENYDARTVCNPTYELAYWEWGLTTAQKWRERLGLKPDERWDHVIRHLSKLPVKDGLYLTAESIQETWFESKWWRDHPSLLAACGMLPGVTVDQETMRRTLRIVLDQWNWGTCWGWDFPMVAMTAARIGEPAIAVDALMMKTPRNHYLPNGHNYLHNGLPVYLTGNGSLLAAVAMMAAGWDGAPHENAPGFPQNGSWAVRWENLKRLP
jgi:hypothetical protein